MEQLISAFHFSAYAKKRCSNEVAHIHYANIPMQYSAILNAVKIENFQMKKWWYFFLIINVLFFFLVFDEAQVVGNRFKRVLKQELKKKHY